MKKKFLTMMAAAFISAPAVFAFHEEDTGHLIAGMPVVFMATGVKFTPQQHSELRAIAQTWFASECFLSQRMTWIYSWMKKEMGHWSCVGRLRNLTSVIKKLCLIQIIQLESLMHAFTAPLATEPKWLRPPNSTYSGSANTQTTPP